MNTRESSWLESLWNKRGTFEFVTYGALFTLLFLKYGLHVNTTACQNVTDVGVSVFSTVVLGLTAISMRFRFLRQSSGKEQHIAEWVAVGFVFVTLLLLFQPACLRALF